MLRVIFHSGNYAVYFKIKPVNVTPLITVAEIKICSAIFQQLVAECGAIVFISSGPQVNPDVAQCIGGIIEVIHFNKAIQRMAFIIESNINFKINLLLPVG